jgi:hypothetical protein
VPPADPRIARVIVVAWPKPDAYEIAIEPNGGLKVVRLNAHEHEAGPSSRLRSDTARG